MKIPENTKKKQKKNKTTHREKSALKKVPIRMKLNKVTKMAGETTRNYHSNK